MPNAVKGKDIGKRFGKIRAGNAINTDEKIAKARETLSTGGGESIDKGHKWTTERRVLQPRDPETGRFDYNAAAGLTRKEPYHAERNGSHGGKGGGGKYKTVPTYARDTVQAFAELAGKDGMIKKGSFVKMDGKNIAVILNMDMTKEELVEKVEEWFYGEERSPRGSFGPHEAAFTTYTAPGKMKGSGHADKGDIGPISRQRLAGQIEKSKGNAGSPGDYGIEKKEVSPGLPEDAVERNKELNRLYDENKKKAFKALLDDKLAKAKEAKAKADDAKGDGANAAGDRDEYGRKVMEISEDDILKDALSEFADLFPDAGDDFLDKMKDEFGGGE